MEKSLNRIGAERFSTPRDIIRDFISILNLLQQNPELTFEGVLHGPDFKPAIAGAAPNDDEEIEDAETTFREFKL